MAYCCQAAIANPEYVPGLEQFPRSNPASWNYPDGCLNRPAFRRSKTPRMQTIVWLSGGCLTLRRRERLT